MESKIYQNGVQSGQVAPKIGFLRVPKIGWKNDRQKVMQAIFKSRDTSGGHAGRGGGVPYKVN